MARSAVAGAAPSAVTVIGWPLRGPCSFRDGASRPHSGGFPFKRPGQALPAWRVANSPMTGLTSFAFARERDCRGLGRGLKTSGVGSTRDLPSTPFRVLGRSPAEGRCLRCACNRRRDDPQLAQVGPQLSPYAPAGRTHGSMKIGTVYSVLMATARQNGSGLRL